MTTPRLRTDGDAMIVISPTRQRLITLLSTNAAAVLGTTGRYSVLLSFMHRQFDVIHCFTTSKQSSIRRSVVAKAVAVRSK